MIYLRSSVSKQHFVPKTRLNIGKPVLSVAVPTVWNQLPITIQSSKTVDTFRKKEKHCLKLFLHHTLSAVSCSNEHFGLSLYMTSQIIVFVAPLSFTLLKI